jgi:DNA-binding Lrp family transcriptional regulator
MYLLLLLGENKDKSINPFFIVATMPIVTIKIKIVMIGHKSSEELINEAKTIVPEVYKDLAKPAVSEVGIVAGRTVRALLAPIRGLLWGWERIEEVVEEGVKKRFEKIPEERRKSPEPEIAVPLIQALEYTAQNETLREMYINLLANLMDKSKRKSCSPLLLLKLLSK